MKLHQKLETAKAHLESLEDQGFDRLDFEWEGIKFHAASKSAGGSTCIQLKADLGRLYFTIEDKDQRALALERYYAASRAIDGRYQIGEKGDIHFENVTLTQNHLKGSKLISALTVILLESGNHLRALRSHLKPTNCPTA